MKTIKAIIIDDEPLAHKVILQYASDLPFLEIVGQCHLATQAYSLLNEQEIDLLFLDINMPKLKGLDFLRTLDKKPQVIITTAYQEFAIEGFELQVADYLLKPFRFERFLKAVNVVKDRLSLVPDKTAAEYIFLKVDKKQIQIAIADIQYLESYGNYVKVWVSDQCYLTPRTLTSFENELDTRFVRIHKSFIVHKTFIHFVEGNRIEMKNGNTISIGKNYRSLVRDMFD